MLLIKTVALLCSATAAMAASAVVSGAIFDGYDTTDQSASNVDIYRNPENHAAAAASVLVFSGNAVDFHPASQEPKALGQSLGAFVSKASAFPGFLLTSTVEQNLALNGSLTQFEKIIREKLNDPLTARAFRDLVPGYIQDKSLKEWILSLIVLSKPEGSDTVNLKLIHVSLIIHSDDTQTAIIPEQTARLIIADLKVLANVLVQNADRFASSIPVHKVLDFINFFASPKVPFEDEQIQSGSTSCTKKRPIFKNQQTVMSWFL
ncbi:hypothetical protein EC957_009522 [Mortierella hygrophila]|uniref:Uncharacterized protein n=1 Tax=Mortierella hygrophila TaxID=979708 RepID=A0A9P6EX00_9FUNG|nr:hypothetical protein EC957_009522 [Mortierella hygrophila]